MNSIVLVFCGTKQVGEANWNGKTLMQINGTQKCKANLADLQGKHIELTDMGGTRFITSGTVTQNGSGYFLQHKPFLAKVQAKGNGQCCNGYVVFDPTHYELTHRGIPEDLLRSQFNKGLGEKVEIKSIRADRIIKKGKICKRGQTYYIS